MPPFQKTKHRRMIAEQTQSLRKKCTSSSSSLRISCTQRSASLSSTNSSSSSSSLSSGSGKQMNGILTFLQKEHDRLSPEEQELALQDLYGRNTEEPVALCSPNSSSSSGVTYQQGAEEEDTDFLREKLDQFNHAIETLKKKETYELALVECPEEVSDVNFRTMFLRADRYHPKRAARRFIKYWDMKVDLWGVEKAFRGRIEISDLSEDDLQALSCGAIRLLDGVTDKSGRKLVWSRYADTENTNKESLLRVLWYILSRSMEDEYTSKHGLVWISVHLGVFSLTEFDRNLIQTAFQIINNALPIRLASLHHVISTGSRFFCIIPILLTYMGKALRSRYRMHAGHTSECLQELSSYGIPVDKLPISIEGVVEYDSHHLWVEGEKTTISESSLIEE